MSPCLSVPFLITWLIRNALGPDLCMYSRRNVVCSFQDSASGLREF